MSDAQTLAREMLAKLERYQDFLTDVFAQVVKKVGNQIKGAWGFLKALVQNAKALAQHVNPIGTIVKSVEFILEIFSTLKDRVRAIRKLLSKVIDLIRRGMNNLAAVMGQVVKFLKRFAKLFRELLSDLMALARQAGPVEKVLGLIARMRRVLAMMFAWIDDVTGASAAIRKLQKVMKKLAKAARVYWRETKTMLKDVRALAKA